MANEGNGETEQRFDILIRGGNVFDGAGSAPVRADVGIIGERIAAVGDLGNADAGRFVDANGLSVAPGFIDIHTHSDISAIYDTGQASAIGMGVTTQVTGNCGLSVGFVQDRDVFVFEKRWIAPHKARITWDTFDGFLRTVENKGTATNFYPLAGHGTLRKRVMGMEERPPSADDLLAMQRELQAAMDAGCRGFSSGLEYPPSSYADENELAELCKIVSQSGGFYATHLRNEGDTLVEAVREALNVVERAGLPLQLSHHKAEGRTNWGKVETTLGMVDAARSRRGLDVQMDQYPYTAFMTALSIQLLPRWALSGTGEETTARLIDPAFSAKPFLRKFAAHHPDWDDESDASPWHNIQIGVCRGKVECQGRTIAALAKEANRNPLEYAIDLIAETEAASSAPSTSRLANPTSRRSCATPGRRLVRTAWERIPARTASEDKIHPRTYGTFPRVLGRYVRELGILTEAEADS